MRRSRTMRRTRGRTRGMRRTRGRTMRRTMRGGNGLAGIGRAVTKALH